MINRAERQPESHSYDGSGERLFKATGSTSVDFLSDLSGPTVTELSSSGGWNRGEIYAGGKHLATYTGGTGGNTYFIHADWLGTERARSTSSGSPYESCSSLPFGDGLNCSGGDRSPLHFTGKQRDTESGLDYFGARYYGSQFGRFLSVDPTGLSVRTYDPQTWDRYGYARGNPLAYIDPNGMWSTAIHNQIIDEVFKRILSQPDRQILKRASAYVDEDQSIGGAYKHGMYGILHDPEEDFALGRAFESANLAIAVEQQVDWEQAGHDGWCPGALFSFGEALHTITDAAPPWHEGWSHPWAGPWNPISSAIHGIAEALFGGSHQLERAMAEENARLLRCGFQAELDSERRRRRKEEEKKRKEAEKERVGK